MAGMTQEALAILSAPQVEEARSDRMMYGTVADAASRLVLLDGDATPTYCQTVCSLADGQRVLVTTVARTRCVIGTLSTASTNVQEPIVKTDRVRYRADGSRWSTTPVSLEAGVWALTAELDADGSLPDEETYLDFGLINVDTGREIVSTSVWGALMWAAPVLSYIAYLADPARVNCTGRTFKDGTGSVKFTAQRLS